MLLGCHARRHHADAHPPAGGRLPVSACVLRHVAMALLAGQQHGSSADAAAARQRCGMGVLGGTHRSTGALLFHCPSSLAVHFHFQVSEERGIPVSELMGMSA